MPKKSRRNRMLGVGGQRDNLPRRALRGEGPGSSGARGDAAAEKRELLRRMRERNQRRAETEQNAVSEHNAGPERDDEPEQRTASE